MSADTYSVALLELGPIGIWMLDEASSPVSDLTGNAGDSSVATGTFGVSDPFGGTGAMTFNGTSQYVRVPYHAGMQLGAANTSFWWCMWVKRAATAQSNGWPALMGRGRADTGHYGLIPKMFDADNLYYTTRNNTTPGSFRTSSATDWQFIFFTFDGSSNEWRFYHDGQLDDLGATANIDGTDAETADLVIAADMWDGSTIGEYFKGSLCGVAFGSGVCPSATQVQRIYEAGVGPIVMSTVEGGISTGDMIYYVDDAEDEAADFELVRSLNARWVRYDFNWAACEPSSKGSYDWSLPDGALALARAKGLKTVGVVLGTPGWANGDQTMFYPPTDPDDLQDYCYALGLRYIPQLVTTWQIGNEPNSSAFWSPAPNIADYVSKYLIPGAAGLRAAASDLSASVTILHAGLSADETTGGNYSPVDFLTGVYSNGGGSSFDHMATHPYTYPYTPYRPAGWMVKAADVYAVMVTNGDGAKEIWGTEWGWHTGTATTSVSEEVQALFAEEGIQLWASFSFAGPLFWYKHRNSGSDTSNYDQMAGLCNLDFSEKLAARVIRQGFGGQVAMPSADSVDGTWLDQSGGSSLFAAVDEDSPSDGDYVHSEALPSTSGCRLKLERVTDPGSSDGHSIRWRAAKTELGADQIDMTVKLYQSGGDVLGAGTLIASFTRSEVSSVFTEFEESLSTAEADSITDYADLYIELFADLV